ncbi:MAG: CinA family protein [Caulobacterales bacterium]
MGADRLESLCLRLLRAADARGHLIATAESCTGGLLAAALTDVEGYAHLFERGFVCYSENSKVDMLGVSRRLIAQEGAVSEPVVHAMAQGALREAGATLAIAITGYAGPGCPNDDHGLVHIAAGQTGAPVLHAKKHFGPQPREAIRRAAAIAAVTLALEAIEMAEHPL